MKKLFSFLAAALLISTAMTSCLTDSDDDSSSTTYHTITAAERAVIIQNIRKAYTGTIKYYDSSYQMDSIASSLNFTSDTTAVLDYPVSLVADLLTYSGDDSARVALQKAPNQLITCYAYVPYYVLNSYWTNYYSKGAYYDITFYPSSQTLDFSSGGHTYKLTFSYSYISYGSSYYNPLMQYQDNVAYAFILLSSIQIDNGSKLTLNIPTEFVGKAK